MKRLKPLVDEEKKQRLIVMNGCRLLQNEMSDGQWKNEKVDKARGIKPGIYKLYLAIKADKAKAFSGIIVHVDDQGVYQQIGKEIIVKHDRAAFFIRAPDIGQVETISYDNQGKASV
ncbi:KfrB domain-containing protein [Methylobacter sp. Wu1]|uniref:KfrB domain-containing protein n=1 Tax=Methylobacter sp. Wu1 TaxID=3119359 RepID=UPI002F9585C7